MTTQTFINLPVKDLARSTAFFTSIGFSFDPEFTDDKATRMIVSEATSVMLAVEPCAESLGESQDDGFMYMRGFRDLDGHQWSFIYLDMPVVPRQEAATDRPGVIP